MDPFTSKIINGVSSAVQMAQTFMARPFLINLDKNQGLPFAIPIEVETHQQNCQSEVSTSLVISKQNKVNVNDNIAPGAYTWELSGYIPGIAGVTEYTNKYTPGVQMNSDLLRLWNKRGAILVYKDIDGKIYNRVAIKSLTISIQKDCKNMTPVRLTLQEINVMDNAQASGTETEVKSSPVEGTILGDYISTGSSLCKVVNIATSKSKENIQALIDFLK